MYIVFTLGNEQKYKITRAATLAPKKSFREGKPENHNPDIQNDVHRETSTPEKSSTFDKKSALKTLNQDTYSKSKCQFMSSFVIFILVFFIYSCPPKRKVQTNYSHRNHELRERPPLQRGIKLKLKKKLLGVL